MKLIKTEDAAGHVLCHDITQIIPGVRKGPVFRKGHVVTSEDIPVLLSVGKENLYVWEKHEGELHEDEAAGILRDICIGDSEAFESSGPSEGKITVRAAVDGLLKIDSARLKAVNSLGQMMIASTHGNFPVRKGDKVAGFRIIPLVIEKEKMDKAVQTAGDSPLITILPFKEMKAGIVTTGNEVAKGLIKDAFGPVLKDKLSEYDVPVIGQEILPDDAEGITEAILRFAGNGADMVLVSGGMSVDPDDRTPKAIKDSGADIVSYGAPTLPGAMFLLSYLEYEDRPIPVMGLPGCVMYARRTVFDLVLPRVLAGERLAADDLASYGEGGMCLGCDECRFPNCGFGK